MYEKLSQYDPDKGAFSTWLFRIAQNALNKHFGSKAVTMHATWEDNFDPAADTATPEQQTLNTEEMTELREAIMQLSEREQRILEMTYWLDMKSGEVAKALGMTPDNVRHVLMEARKKLRVLLSAKEN
jgi:RNA polymerase sigma-70 factor (ECF subfamily)